MKRENERYYAMKDILEQYRELRDTETDASLQSALELMRTYHKHGEKFYWILFYCYLSPVPYSSQSEIIERLQAQNFDVSVHNFGGRSRAAIRALSECYHSGKKVTQTLPN